MVARLRADYAVGAIDFLIVPTLRLVTGRVKLARPCACAIIGRIMFEFLTVIPAVALNLPCRKYGTTAPYAAEFFSAQTISDAAMAQTIDQFNKAACSVIYEERREEQQNRCQPSRS